MRRIVTAAAFGLAIGLGSATAQPLGLGTSPQGTLTYALGASVASMASTVSLMTSWLV